jgi:hypothetical protein
MTTNTQYELHYKCVAVKEIMQEAWPDLPPYNIGGVGQIFGMKLLHFSS